MSKKICRKLVATLVLLLAMPLYLTAGELDSNAARKLDPTLRSFVQNPELQKGQLARASGLIENATGNLVAVLIKTSGRLEDLSARGARIIASVGGIVAAVVPVDRLSDMANLDDVVYIESSKWSKSLNDVGVVTTGGSAARQQFGVNGKGVVVGILDSGIDWGHDDFRRANGDTRIKFLLDLSVPGDRNGDGKLDGSGPYGGTLYDSSRINLALKGMLGSVAEYDSNGHGTHVAGTAVGNGRGTGAGITLGTYAGMAPEADIIFVKSRDGDVGRTPDADMIIALAFIDSVATKLLNEPYVINLSLGGHNGPHDGTSLSEQAIDSLVGAGKRGKVVVVGAGNDGEAKLHAGGNMSGNEVTVDFNVPTYTAKPGAQNDFVYFDIWYSGTANLSFRLTSPNGTNYGPVTSGSRLDQNTSNGNIFIDNARAGVNPLNHDKQVALRIFDFTSNRPPAAGNWKLTISGSSGRYDLWLYDSSMGAELTSNIDYSRLITIPGTAKNAITVGAWNSKKSWISLDGNELERPAVFVGNSGSFSSLGPTRDGRLKPRIAAPGQMIASSYSAKAPPSSPLSFWKGTTQFPNAYVLRDNLHAIGRGTSFSAAFVSGGVALMLQKFPKADAKQIDSALVASAKADNFTGTLPNNKWGYGKVDFVGAMNRLITAVEADKISAGPPKAFALSQNYPNPFNPETTIRYSLPLKSQIELAIYDLGGRRVALLDFGVKPAGEHRITWDGHNHMGQRAASGIYFYRLEAKSSTGSVTVLTKKMMVLR